MTRIEIDCADRAEWLQARINGIGASEAAAIMGVSPWMSADKLWLIKARIEQPKGKDNSAMARGRRLEGALRELFVAQHPAFDEHIYKPYTLVAQEERPWLFATLDGEMTVAGDDGNPYNAVLEIKTAELWNEAKWAEWENQIPTAYYIQVLHQFLATGCDAVYLFAYLIGKEDSVVREYVFRREDREEDLRLLLAEEEKFWASVLEGRKTLADKGVQTDAVQG